MRKEDIAAAAKEMVGTPFHAQGRLPGKDGGLDCIGVVACLARQFCVDHQDRSAYAMRPTGELQPELESQLERVHCQPQEGDILLMAWDGQKPHHVAVYVGSCLIVHAYAQARKVVMQTYTQHWRDKVVAAYRFPGVE